MEMLGWLTNDVSAALASYRKIRKIYGEQAMIRNREQPVHLDKVEGRIEFEHVSFSLEEKEILKDISFMVPAGSTLGIMGATGSGKSSIINLLQRFYDVTEGVVKVDGADVRDLTLKQLRSSIAVVLQDVFLFSDTIEENIRMGQRRQLPIEEVRLAAEHAEARDFIEKMDEQYGTVIGERGVGLSGGQKQRAAVARALITHPQLILADEPTGALDSKATDSLLGLFASINAEGQTILMVTHSTKAASHAKRVLFIKDGEVFHQLYRGNMSNEELYAKISDTLTVLTAGVRGQEAV